MLDGRIIAAVVLFLLTHPLSAQPETPQAKILDLTFHSQVFGEERNFRAFLPPDYDTQPNKRYPVIYFFHGWSERHNRPPRGNAGYDSGTVYGGDNIAAFVGSNDVIVVKWDGANPRKPGEDYVRPYNISPVETNRQFPLYFPEFVRHIDGRFRTIADRDHRATAGLSMGGFMSFWIAGKYPHLIGSASNFMGSSEFDAGPKGFPAEYRHDEMYGNYEGMPTRIVTGSRDFIRWYHRRMNVIWDYTRPHHEHEEFDSEHGTPGMAKTLAFHMRAFAKPLPKPERWNHADVYPEFDVWGWSVKSDRSTAGFTSIENAGKSGFRSSVREWLPSGKILSAVTLSVVSDAVYDPGQSYRITTANLDTNEVRQSQQKADVSGRLHFTLSGSRHEIGIARESRANLTVADWKVVGAPWVTAGKAAQIQLSVLNKGSSTSRSFDVALSSPNPNVKIEKERHSLRPLAAGKRSPIETQIHVDDPKREIVRLTVSIDGATVPIDVPLFPEAPSFSDFKVLDGKSLTLWQRAVVKADKPLGTGNADGIAQPGETIAIAVPENGAHRAVELFTSDTCADLTQRVSDAWASYDYVGATAKITLVKISKTCPAGHEIPLFARYQLPDKPEHNLKHAVIKVRIGN